MIPGPVQANIAAHGYLSDDLRKRDKLSVIFTYLPRQPYSVLMDIADGSPSGFRSPNSIVWEVSREILHDAVIMGQPSGIGDFSASVFGARRVQLRVQGTDTWGHDAGYHYDIRLSRAQLRSFLLRTLDVVPAGQETGYLDIDRQLERLLSS